jgi:hypothetical protein
MLMKKILYIVFTILSIPVFAQEGLFIGAHLGVGSTYITPQNNYGLLNRELAYKISIGYQGGLRLGYGINEELGLLAEVNYNKGGQKYHDVFKVSRTIKETIDKKVDLSYMGGALLFRYSPITRKQEYKQVIKGKLVVMAGFGFNSMLDAKIKYEKDGVLDKNYPTNSVVGYSGVNEAKDLFKPIDVNLIMQIGGDIFLTEKLSFLPSLRIQAGLNDINNENFTKHEAYNKSRNILIGFNFGLGYYFGRENG